MIKNPPATQLQFAHVEHARAFIDEVETKLGSRFYGLENLTKDGEPRTWSIAPRPPKKALAAITGAGKPLPSHLVRRWCAKRHAWRTVDLGTVTKIWFRDPSTKERLTYIVGKLESP